MWSPSGRRIAYIAAGGAVEIIAIHGGRPRRVGSVRGTALDWQPLASSARPVCTPPRGSAVLASNREAVVFSRRGLVVYGCLKALGRTRLLLDGRTFYLDAVIAVRLAGRFAALETETGKPPDEAGDDGSLYDLSSGKATHLADVPLESGTAVASGLDFLALDSSGFAAWRQTTRPTPQPLTDVSCPSASLCVAGDPGTRRRRARRWQLDRQRRARRRLAHPHLDPRRRPATTRAALSLPHTGLQPSARASSSRRPRALHTARTYAPRAARRSQLWIGTGPGLDGCLDARGLPCAMLEIAGVRGRLRDFSFRPRTEASTPAGPLEATSDRGTPEQSGPFPGGSCEWAVLDSNQVTLACKNRPGQQQLASSAPAVLARNRCLSCQNSKSIPANASRSRVGLDWRRVTNALQSVGIHPERLLGSHPGGRGFESP